MNKHLLSLLILLPGLSYAQGGYVCGEVSEAYLQEALPEVEAALLRADSTVISTSVSKYQRVTTTDVHGNTSVTVDRYAGAKFRVSVPGDGKYILRLSLKGYETKYADLTVKLNHRTQEYDAGGFVMFPASKPLGVATVSATRIKMYHKGDTLIYNADAFQTADGSMLDALVRQLPGVEIRDGRIYAQGKFVESILISGKDFFNGNPGAALQSLPAYVVGRLKFYDKSGERSNTMERDMHDNCYVMDVHLKREYQGTWLLNPSVGYGTRDRCEGLLFLMRFDERQSFTLSADINNIGQVREASDLATSVDVQPDRLMTSQYIKGSYNIEPNSKFRLSVTGGYKRQSYRMGDETSAETYLTSGNLFTRGLSEQKAGLTHMQADLMTALRPRKGLYFKFDYTMRYGKRHLDSRDRSARFTADPSGLVAGNALDSAFADRVPAAIVPLLAYRLEQKQLQDGHDLVQNARGEAQLALKGNLLKITSDWRNQYERSESMQHYDLRYPKAGAGEYDYLNRYYDRKSDHRTYKAGAEFFRKYIGTDSRNGQFAVSYLYAHRYDSDLNQLYRLDMLPGWGADGEHPLGTLPSASESLHDCIDPVNSYDWRTLVQQHDMAVKWLHEWQLADSTWISVNAALPVIYSDRRLSYHRGGAAYPAGTQSWLAEPSLTFSYMPVPNDRVGRNSQWMLSYRVKADEPSLLYFPAIRDAADPLNISLGNARLNNTQTHHLMLRYKRYDSARFSSVSAQLDYAAVHDAVAVSSVYDTQTGVRTSQPVNISGNYLLDGYVSFSMPLDRKRSFFINNQMQGAFSSSADLNSAEEAAVSRRNEVKNARAGEELGLMFTPNNKFRLTAKAGGTWNHVFSEAKGFTTLNVYDVTYSVGMDAFLLWKVRLSTDFNIRTRYGYSDRAYGRAGYLWNAAVSRSWLCDQLNLSLELSDILHSRKRIYSELNAWGRVERYARLYTPAYVMLHVGYRLTLPKKK